MSLLCKCGPIAQVGLWVRHTIELPWDVQNRRYGGISQRVHLRVPIWTRAQKPYHVWLPGAPWLPGALSFHIGTLNGPSVSGFTSKRAKSRLATVGSSQDRICLSPFCQDHTQSFQKASTKECTFNHIGGPYYHLEYIA